MSESAINPRATPLPMPQAEGRRAIGRRAVLKSMAGKLLVLMAPLALALGARRQGAVAGEATAHAAAASTEQAGGAKRLRRWAMAIDLRRCDGCQSTGQPPQCTQACCSEAMLNRYVTRAAIKLPNVII